MKKTRVMALTALLLIIGLGCNSSPAPENAADAIYSGGDIVTMEGNAPAYVGALAVKDGKIAFVGSKVDADKLKGEHTVVHNLGGRTLAPGLFDRACALCGVWGAGGGREPAGFAGWQCQLHG